MRSRVFLLALLVFLPVILHCAKHKTRTPTCSDSFTGIKQFGIVGDTLFTHALATDSSCNLYIGGFTSGAWDGNALIGLSDAYLTKYDSTGTKVWTKTLGAALQVTYGQAIATDPDGNIFITGLATGDLEGQTMTGLQDLFLTKFDSNGNKLWTKMLGAPGADAFAYSAATDTEGNVLVAGQTTGNLDANTLMGFSDLFVAKWSSSGTKLWVKSLGAASASTYAGAVSIGADDAVYVGGYSDGGLNGDSVTGAIDAFIVKYSSGGTLQWSKQEGVASEVTIGGGLVASSDGSIYLSGRTTGALSGNSLTGTLDIFLSKYDSNGRRAWTQQTGAQAGNVLFDYNSLNADADGNIYLGGHTDMGLHGNSQVGTLDGFLMKFNPTGTRLWTKQFGTPGMNTRAMAVTINPADTVFVAGYAEGPISRSSRGLSDSYVIPFTASGTRK